MRRSLVSTRVDPPPEAAPEPLQSADLSMTRIGFLLYDVYIRWQAQFDAHVEPLATLSQTNWWVMINLTRKPQDGLSQVGLARSLNVSKVAISKAVDRLETMNLVRRTSHPTDRRRNRVQLTVDGAKLVKRMQTVTDRVNERIGEGIPESRYPELWNLLSILQRNLKSMADDLRD